MKFTQISILMLAKLGRWLKYILLKFKRMEGFKWNLVKRKR